MTYYKPDMQASMEFGEGNVTIRKIKVKGKRYRGQYLEPYNWVLLYRPYDSSSKTRKIGECNPIFFEKHFTRI